VYLTAWRKQLQDYADKDTSASLLVKTVFPGMLKELLDTLQPGQLLPAAFAKCGLWPINKNKVLERIPSAIQAKDVAAHLDSTLRKRLEVRRFRDKNAKKKQQEIKVPACQPYSKLEEEKAEAEDSSMGDSEDKTEPSSISNEEEIENSDAEEMISGFEWMEESGVDWLWEEELRTEELPDLDIVVPRKNLTACVVAVYEGQWFLADICKDQTNVDPGYTRLNYMTIKGKNSFTWGLKEDIGTCSPGRGHPQ
jgi:hypothetical protein